MIRVCIIRGKSLFTEVTFFAPLPPYFLLHRLIKRPQIQE